MEIEVAVPGRGVHKVRLLTEFPVPFLLQVEGRP
ncbi:hypothetical protein L916_12863 [Phytophthora nicotianae]|uniref:Uncharacterized protein n=1 Tax=Phytophthora nicotianae TaxID=4792 RepID=W2ILJ0_PHYNI|nr:hypothetical protein L916_12863 [Phytophthora nicotianae]